MSKLEFILANLQLRHARLWESASDKTAFICANFLECAVENAKSEALDRIEFRFEELLQLAEEKPNPKLVAAVRAANHASELCDLLAKMTFVVETVAHLQGKERELLPLTDKARILLDKIEGTPTLERELDLAGDVRQGWAKLTRQGDSYVMEDTRNITLPKHILKISETTPERLEIHWQGFHEHTNGKD